MSFGRTTLQAMLACLGIGLAGPLAAQDTQPVRVILDWAWRPHHAPFAMALKNGYFTEEGLDVKLEQGRGSATAATLLGQGQFDIAHLNVTNAAQAIAKGATQEVGQLPTPEDFANVEGKGVQGIV